MNDMDELFFSEAFSYTEDNYPHQRGFMSKSGRITLSSTICTARDQLIPFKLFTWYVEDQPHHCSTNNLYAFNVSRIGILTFKGKLS